MLNAYVTAIYQNAWVLMSSNLLCINWSIDRAFFIFYFLARVPCVFEANPLATNELNFQASAVTSAEATRLIGLKFSF